MTSKRMTLTATGETTVGELQAQLYPQGIRHIQVIREQICPECLAPSPGGLICMSCFKGSSKYRENQ